MALALERSPEQWRDSLLEALRLRQPTLRSRLAYYEGFHPLPRAPKAAQQAYYRLLKQSRTNWPGLVVDAVAERLQVVGFRFGDGGSADDQAWHIWQANGLDSDSELAQTDALACGVSYVSVWPDEGNPCGVTIAYEHPLQTIVAYDPERRRDRLAALKCWHEGDAWRAWLCLPGMNYQWYSPNDSPTYLTVGSYYADSEALAVDLAAAPRGEAWLPKDEPKATPFDVVPVVELVPWPITLPMVPGMVPGRAEFGGVTDICDRVNSTIFNRLMATEFAAFRQKWATGLVVPVVRGADGEPVLDANGNEQPVAPFNVAVDRLWTAEDAGAKFGEFTESDLTGYIKAAESDVQALAAITKTPPHYLLGSIINVSSDALKAAESGLVSKVRRRSAHLGEAWEEVMRLAFAVLDGLQQVDVGAEVIWADPETRSEGELVDALVKMASLNVPYEILWQKWGASPQEVERWQAMGPPPPKVVASLPPPPDGSVPPAVPPLPVAA